MLVFADTAPILDGNPDIDAVIATPQRAGATESRKLAASLWRQYDLAVSTQPGDRPTFFARVAGRSTAGMIDDNVNGRIKAMLLNRHVVSRSDLHRVEETLRLADALGIGRVGEIVAPRSAARSALQPREPFAVLHAAPFFRYKQWSRTGWRALAAHLARNGLRIVATGGPAPQERAYLDEVFEGIELVRADGGLSWPQLATLLGAARLFVGPDTSVTHLAAAAACPVVTMYGPTDPRRWGPWPAAGLTEPWSSAGEMQRRGNVWLIQNPLPCMPCRLEGCLRRIESHSLCLDYLPVEPVLAAIDEALADNAS
jgi:heptosyltransferase-3